MPLLGNPLRSRHVRLLGQIPLLLVALLLIYDGFTGSPIAPQNPATVSVGALSRAGHVIPYSWAICSGIFRLFDDSSHGGSMAESGGGWPRALRNKWLVRPRLSASLLLRMASICGPGP